MRNKSERFELRVSPEEKKQLRNLAAAAGLSVAEFLLFMALGEKVGDSIIERTKKRQEK